VEELPGLECHGYDPEARVGAAAVAKLPQSALRRLGLEPVVDVQVQRICCGLECHAPQSQVQRILCNLECHALQSCAAWSAVLCSLMRRRGSCIGGCIPAGFRLGLEPVVDVQVQRILCGLECHPAWSAIPCGLEQPALVAVSRLLLRRPAATAAAVRHAVWSAMRL
jgi:hypothetical protein